MPDVSKEHIVAIMTDILDKNGVTHFDRIGNYVGLLLCEFRGIHFNIKINSNGQAEAWTYSAKQVPADTRMFVLELLNKFQASNSEIQAFINEDNLVIFERSFNCIENDYPSEQAISHNLHTFFDHTIHHKQLNYTFA